MRLSISHATTYNYAYQVRGSIQYLRLTPQSSERQRVLDWRLELPGPAQEQRDPYGNILHVLSMEQPHQSILITAHGDVEIETWHECEQDSQAPQPFLRETRLTHADTALSQFALKVCGSSRDRPALVDLMHELAAVMAYSPGATDVEFTAAEAFSSSAGVCQDHAHAFIACTRSLGLPARYVSGYLLSEDTSHLASHAWAEVWLAGAWYSFDVTNGLSRPERHLKLAVGMDYLDACPVRGMRRGGGSERMDAHVLVSRMAVQTNTQ